MDEPPCRPVAGPRKPETRRRIELREALEIAEERFRQLAEHIGSGVAIYDAVEEGRDFVFRDLNVAGERIEHLSRKDVIGKRVSEVFPGVKESGIFEMFQRVWKTGVSEYLPEALYADDRESASWRENWVYKLSHSGQIVAVYNDITSRKRSERRLLREMDWKDLLFWLYEKGPSLTDRELYHHVLDQIVRLTDSTIGFFHQISDSQKEVIFTTWNDGALEECSAAYNAHYPLDIAGSWVDCVRLGRPLIYNDFPNSPNRKGLPEGHAPVSRFMSVPVIDGEKVDIIFGVGNKAEEYDEDDVAHVRLVAGDLQKIIRLRRSEEVLRRSEERYRNIFENAIEGIFQSAPGGRLISVNPAAARMHGYDSPEEMLALVTNVSRQLYVNDQDRLRYRDLITRDGSVTGFEAQFYRKDGSVFWSAINGRAVTDEGGRLICYEGTSVDITSRKLAEEQLRATLEKLRKTLGGTINAISLTVEARDPYTAGHQKRVANLARAIGQEMGLAQEGIDNIRIAAAIHDIGKISIPSEILSKPSKLSDIERSLIQGHSRSGYEILKASELPWPVAEIVLQHHERLDGSGYPQGLKGDEILLEARIVAVADVVESIASHRPYRPAHGMEKALEELTEGSGRLYDENVVAACVRLIGERGFELG